MKTLVRLFFVGCACLVVLGCKEEQSSDSSAESLEFTHVVQLGTELYKGGPQQGSPPDAQLLPGTKVKIVEEAGSYVLVETENGESGYVSAGSVVEKPN